jgi:hypothetical protein
VKYSLIKASNVLSFLSRQEFEKWAILNTRLAALLMKANTILEVLSLSESSYMANSSIESNSSNKEGNPAVASHIAEEKKEISASESGQLKVVKIHGMKLRSDESSNSNEEVILVDKSSHSKEAEKQEIEVNKSH